MLLSMSPTCAAAVDPAIGDPHPMQATGSTTNVYAVVTRERGEKHRMGQALNNSTKLMWRQSEVCTRAQALMYTVAFLCIPKYSSVKNQFTTGD